MQISSEIATHLTIEGKNALVVVDTALYSPRAIRRAAHRITGRGFVYLHRSGLEAPFAGLEESVSEPLANELIAVRIQTKTMDGHDIEALAGDFLNHLLDETLREEIALETEPVRNLLLAHALSETALLSGELETADPNEDPLGIAEPDLFKGQTP